MVLEGCWRAVLVKKNLNKHLVMTSAAICMLAFMLKPDSCWSSVTAGRTVLWGDGALSLLWLYFSLFAGKEITLLMQTLNTLSTPEEKLAGLCKKYAELVSVRCHLDPCVTLSQCGVQNLNEHMPNVHSGHMTHWNTFSLFPDKVELCGKSIKKQNMSIWKQIKLQI